MSNKLGVRCELPMLDRDDGQACGLWDNHEGECMAYPQIMYLVVTSLAKHHGYKRVEDISEEIIGLWIVRAGFKYRAKVIRRSELEDNDDN